MAKVYTVELGGKEYRLAYGARDAIALKKRFGKPFSVLLRQDVMGMDERLKPGGKPGEMQWIPAGLTDLEVQAAFLAAGIAGPDGSGVKGVTEEKVIVWLSEHFAAGKSIADVITPCWKAVFLSGITGVSIDMDTVGEDEAAPEGNG